MKKTLGNTRKLRNKRGKKTKKNLKGGFSLGFQSKDEETKLIGNVILEFLGRGNDKKKLS